MDTPIAEETIVGVAVGSAMEGLRPVAEFQYADFMSSGFDEITTVLARYHYRTGVRLPVVLRAPSGGGVRASNFHSTNPEPWFAHAPGLKVVCPSSPTDAKGLIKSAVRDDNPVVYLEHKWLYRRFKESVPEDPDFLVPIGKADVKREGTDLTIVTYGAMVYRALEAADNLAAKGASIEVVDLRSIVPMDEDDRARVDRQDLARAGAVRVAPVPGGGRRGGGDDRREGVRTSRRAGGAPRSPEHARALLSPAGGCLPAAGIRHRGRGRADLCMVTTDRPNPEAMHP